MAKKTEKIEAGDRAITKTVSDVKPGVKTSEFWFLLAAAVANIITVLADKMPASWAAIAAIVAAGLYAISRGLAKKA